MRMFALALVLGATSVFGSVVKAETLEQSVAASPLIVHARIGQVQVIEDKEAGRIFTFVEVQVLDALKGTAPAQLIVRQTGGDTGYRTTYVAGAPRFTAGEEAVLFLEPVTGEPSTWLVHAMAAGKYTFEKNRFGNTRVMRNLKGLAFADPGVKGLHRVGDTQDLGTPDEFIAQVKRAVAGGTR